MKDTIKEIESYLADYFKNGSMKHINELLDIQDKIAIHSYRLAEMCADAKNTYNGAYFIRKVEVNRKMQAMIGKGMSKAASQVEAESSQEGAELSKNELETEAEAYKLDLLLGQVNRVLHSLSQRISYLKNEQPKHQG